MQQGRTLRQATEMGLVLSCVAVMGFAGCGGGVSTKEAALVQMGGSLQGALNLTTAVSTVAGTGVPGAGDNTTGTLATFRGPDGITTDGRNLYVADVDNHDIRKIVIASGEVSTLAGTGAASAVDNTGTLASFAHPRGITTDGRNLYVADQDNNKIRKIVIASGEVTTLAGTGAPGAGNDPSGTSATFNAPYGITTDGTNLYVSDYGNNKIRKIVIASGAVTTLAGSGLPGADDNTDGALATFHFPYGITTDGTNLYVADNGSNKIRRIAIISGAVTTIAGSGSIGAVDNPIGTLATFSGPDGITSDGTNLYVADTGNNTIRKIVIASGAVTTLAGSALDAGGAVDNVGTLARFNGPGGITTDGASLFVSDLNNNKIRRIQ
jgi:DNA-binding beta-propeller fold protein YncE